MLLRKVRKVALVLQGCHGTIGMFSSTTVGYIFKTYHCKDIQQDMLINQLRWYKTTDPSWTNLFMLGLSSCLSLTAASLFSRASSPSNFVPRSEVGSVSACRAAEGQHDMMYRNNTINHVYIFHGKGRTKMNLCIYMIWYWMLLKSIGFGIAVNCLHALRVLMLVWALFRRASSLLHDDEVLHLTIIGVSPALQVHKSWPF